MGRHCVPTYLGDEAEQAHGSDGLAEEVHGIEEVVAVLYPSPYLSFVQALEVDPRTWVDGLSVLARTRS